MLCCTHWNHVCARRGKPGQTVVLKHAEIMQHENLPGNQGQWRPPIKTMNSSLIYQGNLRSALATDTCECHQLHIATEL